MEEKLKYIISFILFLFTILNFICCTQDRHFFVIPIVQTEAPERYFVKGNKIYKTAMYFLKKHSFFKKKDLSRTIKKSRNKKKNCTEFQFCIVTIFSAYIW